MNAVAESPGPEVTAGSRPWRPTLLPRSRSARVSLLLLVLFALLRSVLWASVQPAWFAPDEDYHFLYINYLVVKGSVPDLRRGADTKEFQASVPLTKQGLYLTRPRTDYNGSPHAILPRLGHLSRRPIPPPPRGVLEAPAYYVGGALVDNALWHTLSVTRLAGLRYYSAILGAVTVFFAWLLAAQILSREWQQLAAAALTSVQMILAFSASTVTNDVGVAVTMTATLACCAWMLRGPPQWRQGIVLGLLLSISLLTKATELSLLLVAAAVLATLWRTYPEARRELGSVLGWTVAVPLALAAWWYVYLRINTHSFLGALGGFSIAPTAASGGPAGTAPHVPGIWQFPHWAWLWIQQVYRSYWFTFLFNEVTARGVEFWLPAIGIVIVAIGLVLFLIRTHGTGFKPCGGQRRGVLLLLLTALLLTAVPLFSDTWRGVHGIGFLTQQGRFLTPAYPGLAVIAVVAIGELTRYRRRLFPAAVGLMVIVAFGLYWHTWMRWVLKRFYGQPHGHWLRELLHASYDKPAFITQYSLATIALIAIAAFAGAFFVTVVGSLKTRQDRPQPVAQ